MPEAKRISELQSKFGLVRVVSKGLANKFE
jgi:hypothetical protein